MARRRKKEQLAPVWVALVIDESGSMDPYRHTTITGFNEYLEDRKKDESNTEVRVWVTKFSNRPTPINEGVPASQVVPLSTSNYSPAGMTALYDGIGSTVAKIEQEIASRRPLVKPKVLVMTITDGYENNSYHHTSASIANMVKRLEAEGNWTFTFLGCTQDAILHAQQSLGMSKGNTVLYSNSTMMAATRGMSLQTTNYANSVSLSTDSFFDNAITVESLATPPVTTTSTTKKTRKKSISGTASQ